MSFRRHTYPEVLDTLLTDITGGVAAESQPFPPPGVTAPPFQQTLLKGPVAEVISVYGARDGKPFLFVRDKDYKLASGRVIEWQKGAQLPDAGTLVFINYYPAASVPVLTDIETGSVVRTLAEAVSLEIASLSAQLEFVYQSGFVDTASGSALDSVVSLLGISRVTAGSSSGDAEFTRASASTGAITIPAGTRVAAADGKVSYETTQTGSLSVGQNAARIPVRDLDPKNDPLPAAALVLLPVPIAGIGSVSNPSPTVRLTRDESDAELRTRAKNFLHGSERATLGAIHAALAEQGIAADVKEDAMPGYLQIVPHVDALTPEARQRLLAAIDAVRPAGVVVKLNDAVPPVRVNLSLRLKTATGMVEKDVKAVQHGVHDAIAAYLSGLAASDAGSVNRFIGLIQGVKGVEDVKILSVTDANGAPLDTSDGTLGLKGSASVLGSLQITDPALPTLLDVVVTAPKASAPPDQAAIQQAMGRLSAYINDLNSTELPAGASVADQNKRKLSLGKLLLATPLPEKLETPVIAFDNPPGPTPTLPTDASIAPYQALYVFTTESGFSKILAKSADPDYVLSPLERLSVNNVQVQVEP